MSIPLTPIAQLATYYPNTFEITILAEELNNFSTSELEVVISTTEKSGTYRINKPVGKRWKEANPQIGIKYIAEIEFYAPSNRHFISIIEPVQLAKEIDYITPYIDLPFTGETIVACHVWDRNVEFPSMLIRQIGGKTTYRIAVPTKLIACINDIHNRYIVIKLKKHDIKGVIKLVAIQEVLPEYQIQQFELYKPSVPTPTEPIQKQPEQVLSTIEIDSKWDHKEHPQQVTVQAISPSPYGNVVWIVDSYQLSHTPECVTIHQFLETYEQVINEEPAKFEWNMHCIHDNGVLCKHVTTGEINILHKSSNYFEDFIPLTKLEAMNLVYDDDIIPF